jgi:long-chain acyl-CoA synthetase
MTTERTLTGLFFSAVERFADRPAAMRYKAGGEWVPITHAELLDRVHAASVGLLDLGVERGDRVALLSENRPEWAITDYACLTAGCTDVPIYPTLPAPQIAYILRDAGAVAVFVSTPEQLAKIQEIRRDLPALRHVIAFDPAARGDGVMAFGELLERGRAARPRQPDWRSRALATGPDDLATLIYTSGTTGDPKGVMLSHWNIASNVNTIDAILEDVLAGMPAAGPEECLSFLPLSHILERTAGNYAMFMGGVIINYATSVDTVAAEMTEVRPTIMFSVPRLYEKIYARVLENALSGSAVKKNIFFWAKRNAETWTDLVLAKRAVPATLALRKRLADRLVFSKLRARTGGRLKVFVSGGAPLNAEINKFFYAAGLPILEGYGLTETSPVLAVNTFEHFRLGTVGRPIPGVEIRIAEDGEILARGPNIMQGYFNKPEATAEVFTADGFLHTGDIGHLDADGFLTITDRKKDLLVTAGGKNIAPQPLENQAKASKFIDNAVMLGDRRPYPIMMLVPNLDQLRAWAAHKGLAWTTDEEMLARPEVHEKMERELRKQLRDFAQFEMPKKLLLLSQDFTIESGELTPTLKVKRRVVEQRYRDRIEALYTADRGPAPDVATARS